MEGLKEFVNIASKKGQKVTVLTGQATNIQGDTCDVVRDGFPDLFDVKLTSVSSVGATYLRVVPKDGSTVTVAIIDGVETESVIVNYSEIESIESIVPITKLNGDNNGGLVKSQKVSAVDNASINAINQLKQILASWVPTPQDGGAALKALISTWAASLLQTTQQNQYENDTVKHGQ